MAKSQHCNPFARVGVLVLGMAILLPSRKRELEAAENSLTPEAKIMTMMKSWCAEVAPTGWWRLEARLLRNPKLMPASKSPASEPAEGVPLEVKM